MKVLSPPCGASESVGVIKMALECDGLFSLKIAWRHINFLFNGIAPFLCLVFLPSSLLRYH